MKSVTSSRSIRACLFALGALLVIVLFNIGAPWTVAQSGQQQVVVYEECGYGGRAVSLPIGIYSQDALMRRGLAPRTISAIRFPDGLQLRVIMQDGGATVGKTEIIEASTDCLQMFDLDNRITSLIVVQRPRAAMNQRPASPRCDEDRDRDGAKSVRCGGADCDDNDPNRYPGNVEVCDAAGKDEDCDRETYGVRDADRDGFADRKCCNGTNCGEDCDDDKRFVHPAASEVCDGIDNNCSGDVDENLMAPVFPDRDGDGYGDPGEPLLACFAFATSDDRARQSYRLFTSARRPERISPVNTVANNYDCDDKNPRANPIFPENCMASQTKVPPKQ